MCQTFSQVTFKSNTWWRALSTVQIIWKVDVYNNLYKATVLPKFKKGIRALQKLSSILEIKLFIQYILLKNFKYVSLIIFMIFVWDYQFSQTCNSMYVQIFPFAKKIHFRSIHLNALTGSSILNYPQLENIFHVWQETTFCNNNNLQIL